MLREFLLSCQRWKEDLMMERDGGKRGRNKKEGKPQKKMLEARANGKSDNTGH